jgi:hypothetical protein
MQLFYQHEQITESADNDFDDDLFAVTEGLSKEAFLAAWEKCKGMYSFPLGRLSVDDEGSIIRRLQNRNLVGTAIRMHANRIILYFAGLTVEGSMLYL